LTRNSSSAFRGIAKRRVWRDDFWGLKNAGPPLRAARHRNQPIATRLFALGILLIALALVILTIATRLIPALLILAVALRVALLMLLTIMLMLIVLALTRILLVGVVLALFVTHHLLLTS
jgi:hypothetical protein